MGLVDIWPLFGLRLITPRLELRVVRDDDLPGLVDAALAGIHDPTRMPFAAPWTDAPPDELRRNFVQYQWAQRASFRTDRWSVIFTVLRDGRPIGVQDMRATDFATRRTIESGSWLTRAEQGHGLGIEMRAALLSFAFDHLGAEVAESGAMTWNAASLGVSRRLGYRENGLARVVGRPGVVGEELRVRLARDEFIRPDWTLLVDGAEPACAQLLGTRDGDRREG